MHVSRELKQQQTRYSPDVCGKLRLPYETIIVVNKSHEVIQV